MRFVPPAGVVARSRTSHDAEFLAALYASTRTAELARVPWPDEVKRAFLRSQLEAQTRHYDQHYADAEFLVLERDAGAIGRLILRWTERAIHVVDISLIPPCCGRGLGTALMRAAMTQSGGDVGIWVERFNPALRLYHRLGFVCEEDTGVYYRMRWKAEVPRSSVVG
jgi:ribosomal protein S18 acetylase RimI-like enzyme